MVEKIQPLLSKPFIIKRFHSLMGFWLVLFLFQHLLLNSQAALWIGDDASGFVKGVNAIQDLPYVQAIEILFIAFPLVIHAFWGILYLRTAKINSLPSDGSTPSLTHYSRNHAFTWQRWTSWILLFGITAHVIQMRFLEYPSEAQINSKHYYMVKLEYDQGLDTLAPRLNFQLYSKKRIQELENENLAPPAFLSQSPEQKQEIKQKKEWLNKLKSHNLRPVDMVAVSSSFGTAELLMVRETFKNPLMIFLYTIFVLASAFHAFNGLWTFMISWGITLSARSQMMMRHFSNGLMLLITFLGLAAIWGTYWLNLKH